MGQTLFTRYCLCAGLLFSGIAAWGDDLHPSLGDLPPKIFDRELRRALKAPRAEIETKTCSIPLLEARGSQSVDPQMDLNRGRRPMRNEAIHTPNPAPVCKGWNNKLF